MAELAALLDQEIPDGRQHLQESYVNLEKVAKYCKDNYEQAQDKRAALEETKNYTTHSLASVAYQINSLATNFLKLLDLQANQLAEMESSVNYLAQTVNIHKEKVARREIGVLTTNRTSTRPAGVKNGIIFPEHAERPTKYNRKPIDYSTLDDIGHGVRGTTTSKQSRSSSISSTTSSQAPGTKPPTPPVGRSGSMGGGSLSKATGSHYRTPAPPVAPPSVPSHYAPSNYSMGQITALPGQHKQQQQSRGSRYSQGQPQHQMAPGVPPAPPPNAPPPPVGMAHPMSQTLDNPPPPSPGGRVSMGMMQQQQSVENLPPPPSPAADDNTRASEILEASPPLPPPPPPDDPQQFQYQPPPPPPEFNDGSDQNDEPLYPQHEEDPYAATGPNLANPEWIPQQYMEKVVAIYDYAAVKDDELTFSENALIYVTNKNDDGWWEGIMNGVTGLFPSNYVEPCI
ncbi:hypothetical protein FSP39_020212 [Pinctada imbricata]|uniref:SH3 domain-containing protein n=1 Tax=Pinctada imbricata TaxID=66713 RepID=A0AA88YK03_PINIB|nr:hypothetical protein FSP39_020212 [Pinctada imbricata]